MTVAVDLGSGAVKVADAVDSPVLVEPPIDAELAARVGTTVPLIRRDGSVVTTQAPHDAYVRAVAMALDGVDADAVAIVAPDWWSKRAGEVVEQTLAAHASGPFQLVSTAVAAIRAARARHRIPTTVAVLDIGAESSSTTILTEVDGVHRVVGRPAVLHGQAGNEIDRRLMDHVLGWLTADGRGFESTDADILAAGESLLGQVKAAKERLSTRPAATLTPDLPGANAELRLVRSEFDEVARGTVDAIVSMLEAGITASAVEDVGAVLLIGGSVSIPLVTQIISVEVGLPVILDNDPATLAVRGAATADLPATPQRRRWRRRRARTAPNVFDLDDAPLPSTEPLLDVPVEPTSTEAVVPGSADSQSIARRLDSYIERSRFEAELMGNGSKPEPVHIVIDAGHAAGRSRTARWTTAPKGSGWESARYARVDEAGRLHLRVNGRDHQVDVGTELASVTVTMLLIGLNVFVTAAETGELLRELQLNPEHDFRPE